MECSRNIPRGYYVFLVKRVHMELWGFSRTLDICCLKSCIWNFKVRNCRIKFPRKWGIFGWSTWYRGVVTTFSLFAHVLACVVLGFTSKQPYIIMNAHLLSRSQYRHFWSKINKKMCILIFSVSCSASSYLGLHNQTNAVMVVFIW